MQMIKYVIFGTGGVSERNLEIMNKIKILENSEVIAFLDNDRNKWGTTFLEIPVYSPEKLVDLEYDYIAIWSSYQTEIRTQLIEELGVPEERIRNVFAPYFGQLSERYKDVNDEEIKLFLDKMFHRNYVNMFYFEPEVPQKWYEAFWDESIQMYYVLFEGKRMYLKKDYPFIEKKGKKYAQDFWYEQDINSPHRYESGEVIVEEGDVLVDAGVCEGNFSLHNIDKVSKVYLIECDAEWMEALRHTFAPYEDKVVFCDKFLSDIDTDSKITIDTLVDDKVDFIKMDIEGEEIKALHGARKTLSQNRNIKCSVCSYHRHGDQESIQNILTDNHFQTEASKGYMLFFCDQKVLDEPELRRGVIRGIKRKK